MLMNTIVPYPELKRQQKDCVSRMKVFLAGTALCWGVRWLRPYISSLSIFQPMMSALDENVLLSLALFVLRWAFLGGALAFTGRAVWFAIRVHRRQAPRGTAAALDDAVVDEANQRLADLQAACEGPDPFAVRSSDVRIQVFTPAANVSEKDGLLVWNRDGTASIALNSRQDIWLVMKNNEPRIVGLVETGSDMDPSCEEVAVKLKSHAPQKIYRGEGSERRVHFALTRLSGG